MDKPALPGSIKAFYAILWISFIIGVISALTLQLPQQGVNEAQSQHTLAFVGLVIGLVYYGLITLGINASMNWVRVIFTILTVLHIVLSPIAIYHMFATPVNTLMPTIGVVQWVLAVVMLVLIFQKTANEWFKARKALKSSS